MNITICRLVVFREHILVLLRQFWIVSVRFETVLFVSVVSIKVRNTETNRNFFFLVSRNEPKQTRNRSCFGLFRFEPKIFFFHFEDTLPPTLECGEVTLPYSPPPHLELNRNQQETIRCIKKHSGT